MRKTKIVCTIGPSTDNDDVMRELMRSGMNVARFNFSHGDYAMHQKRFEQVRRISKELCLPIATMLDTKGPEVRLGKFVNDEPVYIKDGDTYTLTTKDCECTAEVGSISFKRLPEDVTIGTRILINDGVIELVAEKVTDTDVVCKIIHGGKLSNNKGINVPGVKLSMPYLSDADMNDLEFGAKMGYDFIAASFVRSSADINYLRKFTQSLGWFTPRIIAKIENLDGVENIDEILEEMDELVNKSPVVPLTGHRILIDGENLRALIDDIRLNIPQEIQRAKVVDAETEKIIREAEIKGESIIRTAEEKAKMLVANSEIVKQAKEKAIEVLTQAQSRSKDIKTAGNTYVANILTQTEQYLIDNLKEVRSTKQQFSALASGGSAQQRNIQDIPDPAPSPQPDNDEDDD